MMDDNIVNGCLPHGSIVLRGTGVARVDAPFYQLLVTPMTLGLDTAFSMTLGCTFLLQSISFFFTSEEKGTPVAAVYCEEALDESGPKVTRHTIKPNRPFVTLELAGRIRVNRSVDWQWKDGYPMLYFYNNCLNRIGLSAQRVEFDCQVLIIPNISGTCFDYQLLISDRASVLRSSVVYHSKTLKQKRGRQKPVPLPSS